MARWKKLLLASAPFVWPVACSAQGMGGSTGGATPSSGRPGLLDTSYSSGSASATPNSAAALRSGSIAPNVGAMPVTEGVVPASGMSGCCDKNYCCDGGANWGVTSMATDGPCGWVFSGEVLALRMRRQDPLVLVTNLDQETGNISGDLIDYDTSYQIGFRAGVGYLARSGWLFSANYTRFVDTSKTQTFSVDSPDGSNSVLYVGPGVFDTDIQFSEGTLQTQWKMDYQTLDLMLGAVISPSSCLDIIVNGGARLATIRQTYRLLAETTPAVPTDLGEDLSMRIQGGGPRVGTEARLYLTKCCMVYGRAYSTLLLANRTEESQSFVSDFNGTTFRFFTYTREEIIPMFELAAGIEVSLCEGRVLLGAGYEWDYLFEAGSSHVDIASSAKFNRHVNISLDGFSGKVSFLW